MKLKLKRKCAENGQGFAGLRGATLSGTFLKCLIDNEALIENPIWSVKL